jgi:hypothetical protein
LLAFDVAAPLAVIAALLGIGVALRWPLWWVSACSVLVLLVAEGVAANFLLLRLDSVTVGTDDDTPGLRLTVVGVAAVAVVAAVVTGYLRWTLSDRDLKRDAAEVVRIATGMAEATATFSPQQPSASIDRAAAMMAPDQVNAFKDHFAKVTADLARRNVTASASTAEAGIEAIGPSAASVAVILRASEDTPGQQPSRAVLALRVALTKQSNRWLVLRESPISFR